MKKIRASAVYLEGHVVGYYDEGACTVPQILDDQARRGERWTLIQLTLWCEGVCIYRRSAYSKRDEPPPASSG